jgi:hypothetical protein
MMNKGGKMKHWAILLSVVLLVGFAGTVHVGAATVLPAFPGAMGGGTTTPGGRGGQIIEITNLKTSGAGSYSDCVAKTFPRTCTCRVAGIIPIPKDVVTGGPNLTIDGQTCPGGGIILGDGKTTAGRALVITAGDVVARYLTINPNNPSTPTGPDTGTTGIEIEAPGNVVLDHISCFEAGNKCMIHYTSNGVPIQNVTEQWNFYTLPNVGHPVGPMTDTNASAYLNINQDFHHNFFAWIGHRIALYNTTQGRWVNNLTWNWCDPNAQYGFAMEPQGPSQVDMIGNIWAPGNMNVGCSNPHPVNINATGSSDCTTNCWNGATQPSHYMSGNVCAQGTDWQCAAKISTEGGPETGVVPTAWQRQKPLSAEPNPIVADPVTGLDTKILATVGNSQGLNCDGSWNTLHRNSVDAMVIAAYPKGNGFLFNQNVANPVIPAATPCVEDPVTKVPTAYLQLRGIPPGTNPWTIWPGDTYSILETYANGNGSAPPQVPAVSCAPNPVTPGGASACSANQAITSWSTTQGTITPAGVLTAPTTPMTVHVSGTNANGTGQAPVTVAPAGAWTGWLGQDVLPGAAPGATVVVGPSPGPLRDSNPKVTFCAAGGPIGPAQSPQPSPIAGVSVTVIGGPSPACSNGVKYFEVQSGAAPPAHPTVTCNPTSILTGGTSTCTADQAVTWSASAGTITPAGLFTAPATAQTVTITGTNANGSGSVPVSVTAAPPPVTTYPTVSFTIGVPGGPQSSVTCVANQTTGVYTCVQH